VITPSRKDGVDVRYPEREMARLLHAFTLYRGGRTGSMIPRLPARTLSSAA